MAESSDNSRQDAPHGPGDRIAVLLPLPLAGPYDYVVPEGVELWDGDFVSAPLGKREAIGVVWGPGHGSLPSSRLRSVGERRNAPPMSAESRRFVDWVAQYTLHPQGAVLKMAMSVPAALEPPAPITAFTTGTVPDGLRLTPARERVLAVASDHPPMTAAELAREAGCGTSVVKGLADAGALARLSLPADPPVPQPAWDRPGPDLSGPQMEAAEDLRAKAEAQDFSVTLLDGVPGSGKTEVYFRAVAEALKQERQVLVLLPEIALTAQWLERFAERFGAEPALWHSDLTQSQRRHTWRAVADGRSKVVVGARSALFLPYAALGLIVVDEEHESAFKQEEGVIYNARDMAVVRARIGQFPVVLASATPSLETVINTEQGRYDLVHLPDRHAGAELPDVEVVDMLAEPPPRGQWLSPVMVTALEKTFDEGEQALLFLNRRGYAPLTLCRRCGHRFQCPRCTAWLVEHRKSKRLMCHHCGYFARSPEVCPECEAEDTLAACGPGVERLAEEVAALFPDKRHVLAASDTVTGPKAAAELVRLIENHEADLVIGTQIVAKGYHFPMLTLVGVIDADLGLAGGDLRAAERTYQLLYQVAGRAGRADRPGRVLLQTYMPRHAVMEAMVSGDREAFLTAEAGARKDAGMPPFGRLAALIVSGTDEAAVDRVARDLGRAAPRYEGVSILGPAPAPMALLRGKHRRRLLLKARKDVNVQAVLHAWLATVEVPPKVRVQVDVDPYSFL